MYSRREFGRLALAGLPMTVAFARGFSKDRQQVNGVRIGVQSYSFRTFRWTTPSRRWPRSASANASCFQATSNRASGLRPGRDRRKAGRRHGEITPEMREAMREAARKRQEETRKWRLSVPLDHFKEVRKKFDAAGIKLQAYNYSFNDNFTDEEIDRGFQMAEALGVTLITASSTLTRPSGLRRSPRNIRSPSPCTVIPI